MIYSRSIRKPAEPTLWSYGLCLVFSGPWPIGSRLTRGPAPCQQRQTWACG